MVNVYGHMEEGILVCVYYGPNGERLIRRGHKLAEMIDCPFYVLTVDERPYDEFDAERSGYIDEWRELAEKLGAEAFILRDNESQPSVKVIKEVAYQYGITQIVIGQTPQNRWEEITKGSFVGALQRELSSFIDIHIVSLDRSIKSADMVNFEKGVRAFLIKDEEGYHLSFTKSKKNQYEGIFFKEIGTDFNNGIFKFVCKGKISEVPVVDNRVTEKIKEPPNI